jgi:transcription initiation factor IIE alpha subunit
MNKLKMLLITAIAILSFSAADAQTTKKKTKFSKEKTAMHYQCPMKCEGDKTYHKNGKCPVCNMQMKPVKATVAHANYQCPMKCEGDKKYAKEGKCPVCKMNLKQVVAKKATDGHEGHKH